MCMKTSVMEASESPQLLKQESIRQRSIYAAINPAVKLRMCGAQDLAATPQDSRERFEARRLLPGMAKRIREVRSAVPLFPTHTSWQISKASISTSRLQLSKHMLSARVVSLHGLPAIDVVP